MTSGRGAMTIGFRGGRRLLLPAAYPLRGYG
jgi:hypothetical protein